MKRKGFRKIARWMIPGVTLAGSLALFSGFDLPVQEGGGANVPTNIQQEVNAVEGTFLTNEERDAAIQILKNRDKITRILGPGQVFIYDPTQLKQPFRDPMVIPWTRIKDLQVVLAQIETKMQAGRIEEALAELNSLKTNFPDNPYMARIDDMIKACKDWNPNMTPTPTPTPRFPPKILEDTRAILYSETDPLVLIGDEVLKPGDRVPAPGPDPVTVKRIEPSRVIFEFKGVEYERQLDALQDTDN